MTQYHQKKIAMINDLSGYGRCSLTVAIPVLSAMGHQCCPIPTAILSNHTEFPVYFFDDYTEKMTTYTDKWKELGLSFDAIATGFLGSEAQIGIVMEIVQKLKAEKTFVVVDPVMVATSGAKLISDDAIETLKKELLPLATVITPNIPEAEVLADMKIANEEEMIIAAEKISKKFGCAILVKGGHQINDANDLLYRDDAYTWFHGKRINNSNTHGTGCTLSSAIASNLAKGYDLDTSVKRAKDYISGALNAMLDLGKGSGPMDHSFAIDNEYAKENV